MGDRNVMTTGVCGDDREKAYEGDKSDTSEKGVLMIVMN